jgi:uncharacterized protein
MAQPSPYDPTLSSIEPFAESVATPAKKPRIWPLFVIAIIGLCAMIGVQLVVAIVLLVQKQVAGQSIQQAASELPAAFLRPSVFISMIVLTQVVSGMIIWFFAARSARRAGTDIAERLGLRWPSISVFQFVTLMIGSIPVLLLSVWVVVQIERVITADTSALELYKSLTTPWAVLLIIVIGVFPGFFEELSFRGFMQRRLLQRFSPAVAIGITSVIFGLFHITPHGIALATILGVWLGVISWRTNSVWPGAFCHAFINSGWNVYQVGKFHWGFPEIPPMMFCVVGALIVLAAFAWSIKLLSLPPLNRN